ncbi:hypothetical protein [Microbacterium cremeum]|uniref:hypothetical protein n=1 Tax=Microbacterium cremeum TaxID=2782169 RepID=UPI001886E563|nr:hypothetical protein [Microbacterium cremeum]
MQPRTEPTITLHRRRDRDGRPTNDRRLARELAEGRYVRIAPGSYVPGEAWRALKPIDRHYVRVVEVVDRAQSPVVASHFAAAAVWGIDLIGAWPAMVDVLVPRTGGGRSSGAFRRRTTTYADAATVEWRGHAITTPAQTALDLARIGTFTAGVIALDQVRWARRKEGPLATLAEIEDALSSDPRRSARVRAALEFSTDLSDSVRESEGRVLIDRLGFPAPVLQKRFELPSGRLADVDYYFEEFDHAAEFDGVGKYLDSALRNGRTAEEVLVAEKDRGDELQRAVRAFSRWRTPAHKDPRLLYDILSGAGLPSRLARPPAGLVWR